MIVGILLLYDPNHFVRGVIIIGGIIFVIMGIVDIIQYFITPIDMAMKEKNIMKGFIFIILGIFCIKYSSWLIETVSTISYVYGIIILILELNKIQWAMDLMRLKKQKWFLAILSALISIICAIIAFNQILSSQYIWLFIGTFMIIEAFVDAITLVNICQNNKKDHDSMTPLVVEREDNQGNVIEIIDNE